MIGKIISTEFFNYLIGAMIIINVIPYIVHDYSENPNQELNASLVIIEKICDIFFLTEIFL